MIVYFCQNHAEKGMTSSNSVKRASAVPPAPAFHSERAAESTSITERSLKVAFWPREGAGMRTSKQHQTRRPVQTFAPPLRHFIGDRWVVIPPYLLPSNHSYKKARAPESEERNLKAAQRKAQVILSSAIVTLGCDPGEKVEGKTRDVCKMWICMSRITGKSLINKNSIQTLRNSHLVFYSSPLLLLALLEHISWSF